jgi:hypothetical protein
MQTVLTNTVKRKVRFQFQQSSDTNPTKN